MGVDMSRKMVSFRLPEHVIKKICELGDKYDASMSDIVIASVVSQYMQDYGNDSMSFAEILEMLK